MARRVPTRLTPPEGRRFAFPVGGAFLLLGGLLWWRDRQGLATAAAGLATLLLLAGALLPTRLGPVYSTWMALAHAISKVTTPVFMAIVYFLVIFPIGVLRNMLGGDPMRHRERNGGFWIDRPPEARRSDLKRQF